MNLFELWATLGLDTSEFDSKVKGTTQEGERMAEKFRQNYGPGSKSVPTVTQRGMNALSVFAGNVLTSLTQTGIQAFSMLHTGSIEAASDLQEVQNVVNTTFGDSAGTINQWAQDAKRSYGIGETAAKQYNGTMGAMLKTIGITGDEMVNMSTTLTGLAGDMASFYNLDHEETFTKIRSGISGETEPLKQLGINMSVANLEAFALARGIKESYDQMSEAEKVQLRYEYLMQTTADAQGDFARTSAGYANQSRLLAENVVTLQTNIGKFLLPIVNEGITLINKLFEGPETDEVSGRLETMSQSVDTIKRGLNESTAGYTATMEEIDAKAQLAQNYLAVIEAMEGKEVLTAEESANLANAAAALEAMYGVEVLDENNRLVKTHEELQTIISDLNEIAKRQALDSLLSEQRTAAIDLAKQQIEAQALIDELTPQRTGAEAQLQGIRDLRTFFQENGFMEIPALYGEIAAGLPNIESYMQRNLDGSWSMRPGLIEMGIDPVTGLESALNIAETEAAANVGELNSKVEQAQLALDYTNAQITALQAESAALETAYENIISSSNSAQESAQTSQGAVEGLGSSINALPSEKTIEITTVHKTFYSDVPGLATGLDYVPYNEFPARLHEGEAVLTKVEADDWRRDRARVSNEQSERVTINISMDHVSMRDERDIQTLARDIAAYTRRDNFGVGARA